VDLKYIFWFLALIVTGVSVNARCQTETVLHSFPGSSTDGYQPAGGLVADSSGDLFGTTVSGSHTLCDLSEVYGCGVVYELVKSSNGYTEQVLYSFGSNSATSDGASPQAGLTTDAAGNLFGTTTYGGSPNCLIDIGVDGCGTVFELIKSSTGYTETLLYTFTGPDGAYPFAGLTIDSSGNLYGTTYSGGACGLGTVFELVNSSGSYTERVLHSFGCTSTDGWDPYAGVILDSSGNLYGTTESKGAYGYGIAFELVNSSGSYTENVLYNFSGSDGEMPTGGLIFDASGNLYGTTQAGGTYGDGTVFELVVSSNNYAEKVLYSFKGPSNDDGQTPVPGLVMDASGNLYGTTRLGGMDCAPQGCGIVFELVNSSGSYSERILHWFGAAGDGQVPAAPLIIDASGNLYSTTDAGGGTICLCGTVFLLDPAAIAPSAILSLQALSFDNQLVNTTSPAQSVTVTNSGSADLIFQSNAITLSGANATDFTISANSCSGTSVAPQAACLIMVTFTPPNIGLANATLNIADNASTSPQEIALSGTGVTAPVVTLSPANLAFSSQPVGTTSAAQTVSVTNTGGSSLSVTNLIVTGNFIQDNNCGASIAVGGTCTITVEFSPATTGLLTGTLLIVDNAPNSPQAVGLTGTGTGPVASVLPTSITFGNQSIGATSGSQAATISNIGNANLIISSVAISGANPGDFAVTSSGTTCVANSTVTAGSSCAVNVTFTPTEGGTSSATLMITDDDQTNATQYVTLSGSGEDFEVGVTSGTSSSATVTPGGTASYSVSVLPIDGFTQTVMLSCSGAPSEATCSVNPSSVSLNGSSASAVMVTVTTTAASVAPFFDWRDRGDHTGWIQLDQLTIGLMVGLLLLSSKIVRTPLRQRQHEQRDIKPLLQPVMLTAILASMTLLGACGGGSTSSTQQRQTPGTPPGSYTLTIHGTSGSLSQSTALTLTVN
jgi:uncharacterized repeat protein (TIGR03803 family)